MLLPNPHPTRRGAGDENMPAATLFPAATIATRRVHRIGGFRQDRIELDHHPGRFGRIIDVIITPSLSYGESFMREPCVNSRMVHLVGRLMAILHNMTLSLAVHGIRLHLLYH